MGETLRYLSAAQMREADRRCIEELGIPGAVLMNNAGAAVFREVEHGPVGIVCGKGNNGGDGFVVARLALLAGMEPRVVLLASPDSISGDAATFLRAYQRLGGSLEVAESEADARRAVSSLNRCAVLIDAMLGTGVKGEVRGVFRAAVESWPHVRTVAVDLPSGLDADTGECLRCCIRAAVTVTFQFPKRGFQNPAALPYLGKLIVADIGIPDACADDAAWQGIPSHATEA
ncbi:MAG: NAD(P)H-hydrate epimerase [Candidatus Hydrogenedentales bacterium]|jgi:NAD(P)H-hydrate epimerase